MSYVMNYQPVKYHHLGSGDLYIDHRKKEGFWAKMKRQMREGMELLDARLRILFDKRARVAYRTYLVRQQLREVGLNGLDLLKSETFYIAKLLHKEEKILGAIIGRLDEGGTALIAVTNLRIIYLNQIPLFTNINEIKYDVVEGISSDIGRWDATVTLQTEVGNFTLSAVNINAASCFVESIERVSIDKSSKEIL